MTPQDAIAELSALKWSQDKIARAVNVTQGAIHKMTKGTSPKYETGLALINLAKAERAKSSRKRRNAHENPSD